MSEDRSVFAVWKLPGVAILLIIIMTIFLFQAEESDLTCLLLLVVSLIIVRPLPFKQWTEIDGCLSLIIIYDVISCFYAGSVLNAVHSVFLSLGCLTTYFIVRRLFDSAGAIRIIMQGSYLPIGGTLLLAICSFFIFRQSVLQVGFQDTYHFRFLFRPLGYVTNEWSEIMLILLGWVCLIRRYSGSFIFLTVLVILFSFSRGAYIALGIYIIAWCLLVNPKREKFHLLAVCIAAIILTGLFFPTEMKTTLQMNHTVSQQQSTEGRITATKAGWCTFKERSLFGYGNGNYTFAIDQTLNQDCTLPYTSYAPNIVIQLLIEKGIAGLLLYLWLTIAICRRILKRQGQPDSRIIGCTLLALAAKEMTQATLFYTPFALFMCYVFLAFLQKEGDTPVAKEESRRTACDYVFPGVVLVCYLSWQIFHFLQIRNASYRQQSEIAWKEGHFFEAIRLIEQTGKQTPSLINQGLLYIQYFQMTKEQVYFHAAQRVLQKAYRQQSGDVQIRYLQGQLYIYAKEFDKAYLIIEKLAKAYPKNSLYLSALSDILYQQGNKEAALQPLAKAIRYMPRLLTGPRIRNLQQIDPAFYQVLRESLAAWKPTEEDGPADWARYGYIARWCGEEAVSDVYLHKALDALPNLVVPWHLLEDDRKYRLLLYGAFHKNLLSAQLPAEKDMTDKLLFRRLYQTKFENWYGCKLADYSE